MLQVVQKREVEARIRNDLRAREKAPIEIVDSEHTEQGLRVTLRNNGNKSVKNIRYHVSYFRAADGWHLEPDKESLITKKIPPRETWTLLVTDKEIVSGVVYGSVSVVDWEFDRLSERETEPT